MKPLKPRKWAPKPATVKPSKFINRLDVLLEQNARANDAIRRRRADRDTDTQADQSTT